MSDDEKADKKVKVDALIILAQGAFERRKELEAVAWKMSFPLWTAIGVSTWALHDKTEPEHFGPWAGLLWLVDPLHVFVIARFGSSVKQAVRIALGYVDEVEREIGYVAPAKQKSPAAFWWYLISAGPTALLVGAAVNLLW